MNRREFFGYTLLLGTTSLISAGGLKAYAQSSPAGGVTGSASKKRVVYIFLRGGADFLALFPPSDLAQLKNFRDSTYSEENYLRFSSSKKSELRYHKELGSISALLESGALITHTASMHASRSHFFQQDIIESGSATKILDTGFLAQVCKDNKIKPMVFGKFIPRSLKGKDCLVIQDKDEVSGLIGNSKVKSKISRDERLNFLTRKSDLHNEEIKKAQEDYKFLEQAHDKDGVLLSKNLEGVTLKNSGKVQIDNFVNHMTLASQILNSDYGANIVTVEYTGWDTHKSQSSDIVPKIKGLAEGISAFKNSLHNMDDTTIVIMSEFGRTIRYNADLGTDHGAGSMMLVLGGGVDSNFISKGWDLNAFNDLSGNNVILANSGPSAALRRIIDYRSVMNKILSKYYGTDTNIFDSFEDQVVDGRPLNFIKA